MRGEELTLDEVGVRFGLTRERIRQIEFGALKRLGHVARGVTIRELFELVEERAPQGGLADVGPVVVHVHTGERGANCREMVADTTCRHPARPFVPPTKKKTCTAPLPPSLADLAERLGR